MADRYPRDLGAGERQRVALGAVGVIQPRALLLDEPTCGLDYQATRGLPNKLRDWRDEGSETSQGSIPLERSASSHMKTLLNRQ
jgi:energy-coupling factor transport system ATP-binding protein